jgi:hypothetical protein
MTLGVLECVVLTAVRCVLLRLQEPAHGTKRKRAGGDEGEEQEESEGDDEDE